MRSDAIGMFWNDTPPPKPPKKEKEKKTPPPRTWESEDYLPGLEEALAFNVHVMDDNELYEAYLNQEPLIFDVECYSNYYLAAFVSIVTKKVWYCEFERGEFLDTSKLMFVMQAFCTIGFNSRSYDVPITTLALAGKNTDELKLASDDIIINGIPGGQVVKYNKCKILKNADGKALNHIDLIEVAPSMCSLKLYAGRMGAKKMQDLPFHPNTILNSNQIAITRFYCINDLVNTELLKENLKEELILREKMSAEYGIDLRSKSDAQIAESVIAQEVGAINGTRPQKPIIDIGTWYRYKTPIYMRFYSPTMQWAHGIVQNALFVVAESGSIGMPKELSELEINIGNSTYRMGIGGLHSSEKSIAHHSNEDIILEDRDVVSYYPRIILNQKLFPQHLTSNFLNVYDGIVNRRLTAKDGAKQYKNKLKNKDLDARTIEAYKHSLLECETISDSLKITINGSFGKLGSPYSVLYAPDLLIQVTVTGQLTLLMLIERLELTGIQVVSANTDGVVIKCPKHLESTMNAIIQQWEHETQFETEGVRYKSLYSKDVNNYIAVKLDGGAKTKGTYGEMNLKKNPQNQICSDAVVKFLSEGTPIAQTLWECKDINKFVTVRTVAGGAVKIWPGEGEGTIEYLGKAIRWYYAKDSVGEIIYAKTGNKVARSDGAKPLMNLPNEFPTDIDYDWYEKESLKILAEIGYGV